MSEPLPSRVLLCCIGYSVQEREGLIVFSAERGVAGCFTRIAFERRDQCWYVSIDSSSKDAMMGHVSEAYAIVKKFRGGDFSDA